MHPNLRKASVNWIDGMKVNKSHFQQTEHWIADHLKDNIALSLTDYNYGLLPSSEEVDNSLDYQIEVEQTQFVKITLFSCRAITRGGGTHRSYALHQQTVQPGQSIARGSI